MKPIALFLLLVPTSSFAQSKFEALYAKNVCDCFDRLPVGSVAGITEQNLMVCFERSLLADTALILKEAMEKYGDTSYATGYKFAQEMMGRTIISLVADCRSYFLVVDSMRYQDYKNQQPDSLRQRLVRSYKLKPLQMNDERYAERADLYFGLKMYDSALVSIERALKRNPHSVRSIYLKAWIKEMGGEYDEAILLYDKVADLTKTDSFRIFSAIARRKKSGK